MLPVEAPRRAAIDDLELEPTRRVGDDEGLACRHSPELASLTIEEAPPTALARGVSHPVCAGPPRTAWAPPGGKRRPPRRSLRP
jgi:hypothetical protein